MLKRHFKTALRVLRRQASSGAISIAGLAVGMVSCMFLLLYVYDELGYDQFYKKADRIFRVVTDVVNDGGATEESAYTFSAIGPIAREGLPDVEAFTRIGVSGPSVVRIDNKTFSDERLLAADAAFFDLFSHRFLQGEPSSALVRPHTIVLTQSTAARYFGMQNPIGRTMVVTNYWGENLSFEVTGVVENGPANTHIHFDALASFETLNAFRSGFFDKQWRILYGYTYFLLPDAKKAGAVEAALPSLVDGHLEVTSKNWGSSFRFELQPITDIRLHSDRANDLAPGGSISRLYMLAGIAAFMLLIACFNFISLSSAVASQRSREVGVRKALGASRVQLVHQFLAESALIACIAVGLALVLFFVLLPAFNELAGKRIVVGFDEGFLVLAGVMLIACITSLASGGYAASLLVGFKPAFALKGAVRPGKAVARNAFVLVEFVAAITLLAGAVVVYQQLDYMKNAELGYDKAQVIVLGERFAGAPVPRWDKMKLIKRELLRIPSIKGVTLASEWPTRPVQVKPAYRIEGMPAGEGLQIAAYQVDADYLDMLEMEIVAGRNFLADRATDTDAFLINEEARRQFGLLESDAVGARIFAPESDEVLGTIIGVVKDFHAGSLRTRVEPVVFAHRWARPRNILVKIDGQNVSGSLGQLQETWERLMPGKLLTYDFLDEAYAALYTAEARLSRLAGLFTALALLMACMGLWSMATFSTAQRTREIGVRKVLGASVSSILVLLTKDVVRLVAAAVVIAAPLSYFAMQRWLEQYAHRIDISVWVLLIAGSCAIGLALLAVGYQSIKTALANPIKSIRHE